MFFQDVSCNQISHLPLQIGDLKSLRSMNMRRNLLVELPLGEYWYKPWHEISNNVVCATSKDSDQPAHMCRLIRAFASRWNILWLLSYWPNIIGVSKRKGMLYRLVLVYICQTATLLEITCRGSYVTFLESLELVKNLLQLSLGLWHFSNNQQLSRGMWFPTNGILTSVDSRRACAASFKFRNSKLCSFSSLTVIEHSSQ